MIKINAEDLARVCKNAMMFVNPKSLWLPGEVLFDLTNNTLSVYACDDYFAICATARFTGNADTYFVLKLEDVKTLEEFSRKNKKDEVQVSINKNGVTFATGDEEKVFSLGEYREDNWFIVEGLIYSDEITPATIHSFDSNPERYAKLSQLKYDKNKDWIKWKFFETATGNLLIRFTVGPDISGVIRPLTEPERHINKETDDGDVTEEASISLPD